MNAEVVLEHSASIAASTEYNSNLQYLEADAESTYLYRIQPTYKIRAIDGVNDWYGTLGFNFQKASNSRISTDREDPNASVGWKRTLESGLLGLGFAYEKESSRIAQLSQTGLVGEDGTAVSRRFVADWTRYLTERLTLETQARYEDNVFTGANALGNFDERIVRGELQYLYTETISPFVRLSANDFRADVNRIEYQTLMAGSVVNLSPNLKIRGAAGVSHISTSGDNEGVGFLNIDYTGLRSIASLAISRELFGTAADFVELGDNLTATFIYDLTDRSSVGTELVLTQNKFSALDTQDLSAYYIFKMTPQWSVRTNIGLGNIKGPEANSANNNILGIMFTYNSLKF